MTFGELRAILANLPLEDDEMVVIEVDLGPAQRFVLSGVVYEEPGPWDGSEGEPFAAVLVAGEPIQVGS